MNNGSHHRFARGLAVLAAVGAVGLLGGCGGDGPAETAAPAGKKASAASAAAAKAEQETKQMARGVQTDDGTAPVVLKFDLKARPVVGEPLKIDIALMPHTAADALRATFICGPEMGMDPASTPVEFKKVEQDKVYRHEVTVTPRGDGAFYVSAIVQLQTAADAPVKTFSIPILVGAI